MKWIPVIMTGLLFVACGGAPAESKDAGDVAQDEDVAPETEAPVGGDDAAQAGPSVVSSVTRGELELIHAKGLGHLLAMVQTDSFKKNGRFVGWRIVSFRSGADEVLGLRPDDVITRVNGMVIENPDQAWEAFENVSKAETITFAILRDGEAVDLSTPVAP